MTSCSSNFWKWQEKFSSRVSSFFTVDGRQKVPRRWGEERKKWVGIERKGWFSDFHQKSAWRFPVSQQSGGQLTATCETCFPFLFICTLTISKELTRCSLFRLNRYRIFFYLFDGSQVPLQWRHDVIGKDAEQEGLYFLFTSVKEKKKKKKKKSGSNETLIQKGPRVCSRVFGLAYETTLDQRTWNCRCWFTLMMWWKKITRSCCGQTLTYATVCQEVTATPATSS